MITIKNILPFILCLSILQCDGQKESDRGTVNESVDAISPGTPFTLKRENVFLNMPDGFIEGDIGGIVVLSVYIDSSENLQGFKIMKLQVNSNGEAIINFVNESSANKPYSRSEYPEEVQRYYPVIERYISKLQFERDERIPLKALNEMTFIARLK